MRVAFSRVRRLLTAETAFGWKEGRAGVYALAATETITQRQEIFAFVAENAAALKVFVERAYHNPTLIHVIDLIIQTMAAAG